MARLPTPGGDSGNWGTILNNFLSQVHASDGTLKTDSVTSDAIAPNAVTTAAIAPAAITVETLAPNTIDDTVIADGSITNALIADGTIEETKLATAVQTKLNATAPVTSVASKTGDVSLAKTDVGLDQVDNTSDATKNAATATLTNKTITAPIVDTIKDTNNNTILSLSPAANAVNYLQITNRYTGAYPLIQTVGTDADIGVTFIPKGSGPLRLYGETGQTEMTISASSIAPNTNLNLTTQGTGTVRANGVDVLTTTGTQTLTNKTLTSPKVNRILATNGTGVLDVTANSGAVNATTIYNSATGVAPYLESYGSDTHIGFNIKTKGTGVVQANGVEVATVSGTQALTNKTLSGANNTITDIPASATPYAGRKVGYTNASIDGQLGYWTKLASFPRAGNVNTNVILSIVLGNWYRVNSATIMVGFVPNNANPTASAYINIDILSGSATGDYIHADSFKVIAPDNVDYAELWMKTYGIYVWYNIFELAKSGYNNNSGNPSQSIVNYAQNSSWQSAEPTGGNVWDIRTTAVKAFGDPIATEAATQTFTNKTISGASNTLSNIAQSAVTSLTTDLANRAQLNVYNSANVLKNVTLNTNPESAWYTFEPNYHNDLSYNLLRGGAVDVQKNGSPFNTYGSGTGFYNVNGGTVADHWFKQDTAFCLDNPVIATDTYVITVDIAPSILQRYGCYMGIVFPHGWGTKDVQIEVYKSGWSTLYTVTDNSDPVHRVYYGGDGTTYTKIRYTLGRPWGAQVRISSLFSYAYDSAGRAGGFLPRGGGDIYGSSSAPITFTATGSDTNIHINMAPKGTGTLQANGVDVVTTSGTQTLSNKTITSPSITGSTLTNPTLSGNFQGSLSFTGSNTGLFINGKGWLAGADQAGYYSPLATANSVVLRSEAGDLFLSARGTGDIKFITQDASVERMKIANDGTVTIGGVPAVTTTGSQTLTNKTLTTPRIDTIRDTNGVSSIAIAATASAVNYITVTNNTTGAGAIIASSGSDTDVNLLIRTKNNGAIALSPGATNALSINKSTTPVNWFRIYSSDTGADPEFNVTGSDTNVSMNITTKGSGVVKVNGNLVGVQVAVPASASAAGVPGQFAVDANYIYHCVATNTWVRSTAATW